MVKHIVFWRVKDRENAQARAEHTRAIKERIDAIRGKIPGMTHIEAGVDFSATETSFDVVLYSEFESRAALDAYQAHPVHKDMAAFITERRAGRAMIDYEV